MFGASLGSLNLKDLQQKEARKTADYPYRGWEDVYRRQWTWDKVAWGSHCVDCYPGNCPYRIYIKDGVVWCEEQAGSFGVVEPGVPDMNPMGCQKGAGWGHMLHAKERVAYPLKRAGERGEGKWQRISWDEALTEVADAVIDAIQETGPESVIHETTPAQGGLMGVVPCRRFINLIGGMTLDLEGMINDFNIGQYITFGKFTVSSVDDWFHSELIIIWHMNPVYTRIPYYHYLAEARYRGAEVVTIAPDFSPSAVHADYYVPVRPGADAALALAMCKVIVDEGLYDAAFIKEQTDLPFLVRLDNRHFLRQSDLKDGGRDDQFYVFDSKFVEVAEAPRGTLAFGDVEPTLEGTFEATLKDGAKVKVRPLFELLKEKLAEYEPERASQDCGSSPEIIRTLARKVAARKTNLMTGFNVCKYYHGDLMERSMCLLLALTGNWGKKGAGIRSWSPGPLDGVYVFSLKQQGGPEATLEALQGYRRGIEMFKEKDPTITDELASIELGEALVATGQAGTIVPSSFFLYYQAGYRDRWNRAEWSDPSMTRTFDQYLEEGLDKWWRDQVQLAQNTPPRVFLNVGGNVLRRTRGGQAMLVEHLWPKLKMIVTADWRLNTTALYSDIFLPVATNHEKVNLHYTTPHAMQLIFADKGAEAPGEAKPEWEIFSLLTQRVEERAKARGLVEYQDHLGGSRRLDDLFSRFTLQGEFQDGERVVDEWVRDSAASGNIPGETTLETLREKGFLRLTDWGIAPMSLGQASDLKANETHSPYRWHVERKLPYPTLTRRAQFYIDHDWFLEAGEALPTHKETPAMGGDYPFQLTSGHNRWSIHSMNSTNRLMLETHRGRPHVLMNPNDAAAGGIADDEEVRVYNDAGSCLVPVKLSPSVRPGQLIIYNGWEPYLFRDWQDAANVEPGMVKWLHLAAGYGHLRYRPGCWQIITVDRATRVDVAKL